MSLVLYRSVARALRSGTASRAGISILGHEPQSQSQAALVQIQTSNNGGMQTGGVGGVGGEQRGGTLTLSTLQMGPHAGAGAYAVQRQGLGQGQQQQQLLLGAGGGGGGMHPAGSLLVSMDDDAHLPGIMDGDEQN